MLVKRLGEFGVPVVDQEPQVDALLVGPHADAVRGNSFEGYVNDTKYVSGVTRYGSGEADLVVPPDDGTEDWYTAYTGKFLGWGVVPGQPAQGEMADDYALFIYR